ncbi:hypothetical protein SISNIDRAFT_468110 [Sistotremastrum niveocremeum HHB9708]|uniref:Uncharacterized protein n=1 Tax=Sistotremastrum niveocremeum HHB9708 TaxID=1314777 RepID=A0A164RTB9_9AGAM|nr:hypothetical protein SISNIDRAFT_468110 [Sistotremastrum niveocremeum HHB9708]
MVYVHAYYELDVGMRRLSDSLMEVKKMDGKGYETIFRHGIPEAYMRVSLLRLRGSRCGYEYEWVNNLRVRIFAYEFFSRINKQIFVIMICYSIQRLRYAPSKKLRIVRLAHEERMKETARDKKVLISSENIGTTTRPMPDFRSRRVLTDCRECRVRSNFVLSVLSGPGAMSDKECEGSETLFWSDFWEDNEA